VKQLVEDFARYLYLPRLKNSTVLLESISDGVSLLTWEQDSFGFADSFDEAAGRYKGLRAGTIVTLTDAQAPELVVKPDVASKQLDRERPTTAPSPPETTPPVTSPLGELPPSGATKPKRFHGTVELDAARVGRDAGKIAEEVIAHLAGMVGAGVTVTLEIHAEVPAGVTDNVVRTVTENCRALKFSEHGFEKE